MSFEQFERAVKMPTQRTQRSARDSYAGQHFSDHREHPVWHWTRVVLFWAMWFAIGWMAAKGIA
jgi:hypothetical protein